MLQFWFYVGSRGILDPEIHILCGIQGILDPEIPMLHGIQGILDPEILTLRGIQGILDPKILAKCGIQGDPASWNLAMAWDPVDIGSWFLAEAQVCQWVRQSSQQNRHHTEAVQSMSESWQEVITSERYVAGVMSLAVKTTVFLRAWWARSVTLQSPVTVGRKKTRTYSACVKIACSMTLASPAQGNGCHPKGDKSAG